MAAPMPIGAKRMMMATNLNITSATPSAKARIASLGRPLTWVSAMAKSTLQNTAWSTSFRVAASKKLWGTTCSRKEPNVISPGGGGALGSAGGSTTPTPGCTRLPATSPIASAIVVMIQKYPSDFSARRPMRFRSSPWPAMPITRVPKMSGTTIDLIIRRKVVESGLRNGVKSRSGVMESTQPTTMPTPMPTKIQCVSESLRSARHMSVAQRPTSSPALASMPASSER